MAWIYPLTITNDGCCMALRIRPVNTCLRALHTLFVRRDYRIISPLHLCTSDLLGIFHWSYATHSWELDAELLFLSWEQRRGWAKGVTPGTPIQLTNKILETYTHTHAPNKSAIVGNCAISNAIVFAIMRLCACVCVSQRVLRMALKRTNG